MSPQQPLPLPSYGGVHVYNLPLVGRPERVCGESGRIPSVRVSSGMWFRGKTSWGVSRGVLQASESVGRKSAGSLPLEGLSLDNRRTEGRGANSRMHSLQRQEQASGTEGRWMEGRKSFSGRPSQTTPGKEHAYRGNDSRTVAQCGFLCFIYICNS